MSMFFDVVVGLEECCRLILQKSENESLFAIILIDALIDIHSHKYAEQQRFYNSSYIDIWTRLPHNDTKLEHFNMAFKESQKACGSFDNRFRWLSDQGIITDEMSQSVRFLHEYRNQYLHRLKKKSSDGLAFAKLYLYLYEQLFIAIPINSISSKDYENCEIVKQVLDKRPFGFANADFRKEIIQLVNDKYELHFSNQEFLNILVDFLMEKYKKLIDSLHFIIEESRDKERAIKELEDYCKTGKITVTYYGESEDNRFNCSSYKTQNILGRIRKLLKAKNEHEGLQKFVELCKTIEALEEPIFEKASQIEAYIQYQLDVLRGK